MSRNFFRSLIVVFMVAVLTVSSNAAMGQDKTAVPDRSQQRDSLKMIKSVFETEYDNKTVEGRSRLAEILLAKAVETSDSPVDRFVLLSESIRLAAASIDADTAVKAIEVTEQNFQVDSVELRVDLLSEFSGNLRNRQELGLITPHVARWVDAAYANDAYDAARQILNSLSRCAKRVDDNEVMNLTDLRIRECKNLAREYKSVPGALEKLQQDEANASANKVVGNFYCFVKGDFTRGLPYLAKSDSDAASIAEDELKGRQSVEEQIDIADRWWELSRNFRAREHAAEIYSSCVEQTTGLNQKKLENRITEFAALRREVTGEGSVHLVLGNTWHFKWKNGTHPDWERAVFNEAGVFTYVANGARQTYKFTVVDDSIRVPGKNPKFLFIIRYTGAGLQISKYDTEAESLIDEGVGVISGTNDQ